MTVQLLAGAAAGAGVLWVLLTRATHRQSLRPPNEPQYRLKITHDISSSGLRPQTQLEIVLLPLSSRAAESVLAEDNTLTSAYVIGLDCEWQPDRRKDGRSPVSLLQLCTGTRCFLAQLLHMDGVPSLLRYILENPLVVKVCCSVALSLCPNLLLAGCAAFEQTGFLGSADSSGQATRKPQRTARGQQK
jgi:hypothetical protein